MICYKDINIFIKKYKFEIAVVLSIVFLLLILIFHKKINEYFQNKQDFDIFDKIKYKKQKKVYKNEEKCRSIFERIFKQPFKKARPEFLRRNNGYCLELDGYNENLKLAFEYNGIQHYKFSPMFHKTIDDFEQQKIRDIQKREYCMKHGITLIEIPYSVPYKNLESFITMNLIKTGFLKNTYFL